MKKTWLWVAGLLAVLALTSCYWRPNFNAGALSLDLSGIKPRAAGDVVRVYLIADGLLFSSGAGVPFTAEVPAKVEYGLNQKIGIEGLPVGPKYKAMVGMGPITNGMFSPYYYGESPLFVVTANADTAVNVTLNTLNYTGNYTSFSPDLFGRNIRSVVDTGSDVYAGEARKLYITYYDSSGVTWNLNDSYDLSLVTDGFGVSSYQLNGLSQGVYLPGYPSTYIDSSGGILPFYGGDGWSFNTDFSTMLTGSRDIRESGSLSITSTYTDYAVFFRRENGLGGTYVAYVPGPGYPPSSAWTWLNQDASGISDMVVSENNAYYAANGSIFALRPAYLSDPTDPLNRVELAAPAPVQSLGFRPVVGARMGTLSLGTTDGVWQSVVDEASGVTVTSGPTQVMETAGDSIERIAIYLDSFYGNAEAYLSRYYLYIKTAYGVDKIPFFAVVPGRATGMAWAYGGTLYISGTEGLAAIAVSAYWGGSGI